MWVHYHLFACLIGGLDAVDEFVVVEDFLDAILAAISVFGLYVSFCLLSNLFVCSIGRILMD